MSFEELAREHAEAARLAKGMAAEAAHNIRGVGGGEAAAIRATLAVAAELRALRLALLLRDERP